ncbi:MAG: ATP-binding protein [Alphaproteobacteria bacterium]|nr:ATP-binding protein [Alphaproteobacteria bacterium]
MKMNFIGHMFKRFLPKGLMGRTMLSLIIPMIMLQTIVGYVFYDRHWDTVSKRLVNYYVNSIKSAEYFIDFEDRNQEWIKSYFKEIEDMDVSYFPNTEFVKKENLYPYLIRNYPNAEEAFRQEFGDGNYNIIANEEMKHLRTEVNFNGGLLVVESSLKKLFTSSTAVVFLWIIFGGIFAVLIAYPFIRGQVRSIEDLAQATEDFGKGKEVVGFVPSGASQIRRTGNAFLQMQSRITRVFNNRMKMLFAISHDLRTPLTRMLLEVQKTKDLDLKENLNEEIEDMKRMIDEYLEYAKGEGGETTKKVDVEDLLGNVVDRFNSFDKKFVCKFAHLDKKVDLKPEAMKRCLNNVIMNAVRYADTTVLVKMRKERDNIVVNIEDDGCGIPEDKRDEMFKPFARIETSRNTKTGGVGLGLAIAKEIVLAHGGDIYLKDGHSLKGLRVKIVLPI